MGLRRNKKLKKPWLRVAGSRPQGPVGQVSRGHGARAPRAWGPAHGAFSPQKPPNFGGGDLETTKPGYPPYPPPAPHPPAFWGCKGERKRVLAEERKGFHPLRLRQPSNTPPKVVGQVSRGHGARAPRAWGPAHQGPGPFPHNNPNLSNHDFFANLLAGAWRRRGCRLKRLLRRWGPGGKRSRDTPPTPPPPHPPPTPPPPPAFWGCKGERKRVFTLSAFGNHPTRPPRSADRA